MATVTLRPDADVAQGQWVNEGGTNTLWSHVDDDPDSPNDADYINGNPDAATAECAISLQNLIPLNATVTAVELKVRQRRSTAGDDSHSLSIRVDNSTGGTILVAAVNAGALTTSFTTATVDMTGNILVSSSNGWDNARLVIAGAYTRNMGADGSSAQASAVELTVTYTGGVSSVTLEASISTSPTISADFVRTLALAASLAPTPTVAADFVRQLVLEATLAPSPTVSSELAVTHTLEAAISTAPTVSADLSLVKLLDAAISTSPTISADFVRTLGLAASITTSPTISADLVNTVTFATAISCTSTVTAAVVNQITLAATLAMVATVAADLEVSAAPNTVLLETAISTSPTLQTAFVTQLALAAAINAAATLDTDLAVSRPTVPGDGYDPGWHTQAVIRSGTP